MAKADSEQPVNIADLAEAVEAVTGPVSEIDWSTLSYDDAVRLYEENAISADSETMGDGFVKLPNKDQLVGRRFLIVRGTFTPGIGKYGEKVTLRVIVKGIKSDGSDDQRFFFSDGSTGIYKQLRKLVPPPTNTFGQVVCPKGLRVSRFHWDEKLQRVTRDGEPNAGTHYIDVS